MRLWLLPAGFTLLVEGWLTASALADRMPDWFAVAWLLMVVSGVGSAYMYGVGVGLRHGRLDCKRAYEVGRDDAIRHLMV